jgi:aromatic ring-opening dioxygenase catalytic subunit (LigB family)
MWTALEIVPWSPDLAHGQATAALRRQLAEIGARHAETGGVIVIQPDLAERDAFPVVADDPIAESGWQAEWGAAPPARRWDGLPFLAEFIQRAARREGVPVTLRHAPLAPSLWLPLREIFPTETAMPVLPVGLSGLGAANHRRFGRALRAAADASPKPIAVIVAGHAGPAARGVSWAPLLEAVKSDSTAAWQQALDHAVEPVQSALWNVLAGLLAGHGGRVQTRPSVQGLPGAVCVAEPTALGEQAA